MIWLSASILTAGYLQMIVPYIGESFVMLVRPHLEYMRPQCGLPMHSESHHFTIVPSCRLTFLNSTDRPKDGSFILTYPNAKYCVYPTREHHLTWRIQLRMPLSSGLTLTSTLA